MIKFKLDVYDALKRAGFNTMTSKMTGILSQGSMMKIKNEEVTNLNLATINQICLVLDMQPKDLLEYIMTEEDLKLKNTFSAFSAEKKEKRNRKNLKN